MALPSFDEQVAQMDALLLDTKSGFGSLVVIELASGESRSVSAIVDRSVKLSEFSGSNKSYSKVGGGVVAVTAMLAVSESDADGVSAGDGVIVAGERYFVLRPPESDGSSLFNIYVGAKNGESTTAAGIRFRS